MNSNRLLYHKASSQQKTPPLYRLLFQPNLVYVCCNQCLDIQQNFNLAIQFSQPLQILSTPFPRDGWWLNLLRRDIDHLIHLIDDQPNGIGIPSFSVI